MSENIFAIRLLTGEEIIGKIEQESPEEYIVEAPVQLLQIPQENGSVGMGLAPYMQHCENAAVALRKSAISVMAAPKDTLKQKYCEMTGSIIVPSSKIQLSE